jgi:hypothetical protein
MTKVAALRAVVDEKTRDVAQAEAELSRVTADEARVRENLKVVTPGSALAGRLLRTLGEQEDRLAAIEAKLGALRSAVTRAQQALAEYVRGLHVGPS